MVIGIDQPELSRSLGVPGIYPSEGIQGPYATFTPFGWVVAGHMGVKSENTLTEENQPTNKEKALTTNPQGEPPTSPQYHPSPRGEEWHMGRRLKGNKPTGALAVKDIAENQRRLISWKREDDCPRESQDELARVLTGEEGAGSKVLDQGPSKAGRAAPTCAGGSSHSQQH